MKSKELLKVASAIKRGLLDGIKSVFNIQPPSKPKFDPGIQPDIKEAMLRMEQAASEVHPEMTTAKAISKDDFMQAAKVIRENTKTPAQEVADALNRAAQSYDEAGEQARALIRILRDFSGCPNMQRLARESTNNWKKMHGLPMKRRSMQERRRKIK